MSYFLCPECRKYSETIVTDCRKAPNFDGWRRRRKCLSCHHRFSTVEVVAPKGRRGYAYTISIGYSANIDSNANPRRRGSFVSGRYPRFKQ